MINSQNAAARQTRGEKHTHTNTLSIGCTVPLEKIWVFMVSDFQQQKIITGMQSLCKYIQHKVQ